MDAKEILHELKQPFDPKVIHWRVGATNAKKNGGVATSGIALAYVNARDVMLRLDTVMGLDWQNRYPFEGCCDVGLKIDGEWMWRSNGAGTTDIEGEKGQYSDAFKRAAVCWGVGRYLYYLPNTWVNVQNKKILNPPVLPSWALPREYKSKEEAAPLIADGDLIRRMMDEGDDLGLFIYSKVNPEAVLDGVFDRGQITKQKNTYKLMGAAGSKAYDEFESVVFAYMAAGDDAGLAEEFDDINDDLLSYLDSNMNAEQREYLKEIRKLISTEEMK